MDRPEEKKTFTRRAVLLGGIQLSLLGLLTGRLAWLQLAQGDLYQTLSDKNRINVKLIPPLRGEILDRFGVPLAVNKNSFRAIIIPEQTADLKRALFKLKEFIDLKNHDIERVLRIASRQAKFVPIEVKTSLSWEELARIEVNIADLSGVSIDTAHIRNYPFLESTAHIVGYVGAVSKGDLTGDPVLTLPGFRIGKTGIEKRYNAELQGRPGTTEVEVNVVGREVRELKRKPGQNGKRVTLTIDAELQRFVQARLSREQSASCIVMDVHSGAVYALASHPSFDPNIFIEGLSAASWEELLAQQGHPLTNKAIAGQYPPASTFKMITAIAGMRADAVNRSRRIFCPGHFDFAGDRFHCWKSVGHGSMNIVDALAESCDVYFYQIATEIGIEKIAEVAREFGLGDTLNFELEGEKPGLVPDKDWKMGYFGEHWKKGETVVSSIGQGYFQSTPLQLATMTARMVNGGYAVKPWLTGYVGNDNRQKTNWPKMQIDEAHLRLLKKGMDHTVNRKTGTAHGSMIEAKHMRMAGKTGTAQVRKISLEQRLAGVQNADLPWHQRHHALFVGYAPLQKPQYACAVVVEHGVGGSITAAPIAKDVMLEVQKRNPAAKPVFHEAQIAVESAGQIEEG